MEFGFGSGILTGLRTDNTGTNTPIRFGALQSVSVEFSGDTKELFATQQYPIDAARGKTKITGKAKVAEIKGVMYNDLFFGQTLGTGQLKYAYNESSTLGTGAATYTVANSGSTPLADQGVFFVSNGNQLTAVSSAPGASQYIFTPATGVYTFSTHSASLGMWFNYTYTVATGYTITLANPLMGNTPTFQVTLFQQFKGNQIVLVLNQAISNRLSFPTTIDDYTMQDLDFSAYANSANLVGSWGTAT